MGMKFNPQEHIIQLKGKQGLQDYLPVQWRLVWFRECCPDGTINTEMILIDLEKEIEAEVFVWNPDKRRSEKVVKRAKGVAIFKATIKDGKGGIGTGTKLENAASFGDFVEKAETGAIGRALAALGYGTQFTGDEMREENRIVDSPILTDEPTAIEQAGNVNLVTDILDSLKDDLRSKGVVRNPQQWAEWKKLVIGRNLADVDLTPTHLQMMRMRVNAEVA